MSAPRSMKRYGSPAGVAVDGGQVGPHALGRIEGDRERAEEAVPGGVEGRLAGRQVAGHGLLEQERRGRRSGAARGRGSRRPGSGPGGRRPARDSGRPPPGRRGWDRPRRVPGRARRGRAPRGRTPRRGGPGRPLLRTRPPTTVVRAPCEIEPSVCVALTQTSSAAKALCRPLPPKLASQRSIHACTVTALVPRLCRLTDQRPKGAPPVGATTSKAIWAEPCCPKGDCLLWITPWDAADAGQQLNSPAATGAMAVAAPRGASRPTASAVASPSAWGHNSR